ncbi:hypothetical protein FB567DRAFT_541870 [Paraphoma chrysanthemicola]|uniref:S-adenosyl-L-methionine-dependent methyltransferase n=1 Tax=Paraphoma chrysanthemicola TaxID=798071 RepID=A0A8K0VQZ4_9PLEO|nr:hypothetical protein FB567DRAFT_541870 [Paraphoma chrysanthemicola]
MSSPTSTPSLPTTSVDPTLEAFWSDPEVAQRYLNAENATRPMARALIQKTDLATRKDKSNIFDLATGTGAAVQEIYDAVPKEKWGDINVLGGDVSQGMLSYLDARGKSNGWTGLRTQIVDGNNLQELVDKEERFTHTICTFAIFILPTALPHLHTLTLPGGFIGLTTWTHLPWYPIVARSISLMPAPQPPCPSAAEVQARLMSNRAWGEEGFVAEQLREAGFVEVQTDVKRAVAKVGTPKVYMASMQFPLGILRGMWEEVGEEQKDEWMKVLNEVMYKEVVEMVGGEDGVAELEFEAVVAWGRKGE